MLARCSVSVLLTGAVTVSTTRLDDLIFDVGFHTGEDTEFYLKKGFRVVAVEANPDLARAGGETFASAIASGQLTIVNKAVAETPGEVTFFLNTELSVWGTLYPEWAERNDRLGAKSRPISVEATTMADLFGQYGVPYYLKIDIEGADLIALKGLEGVAARPKFVSLESDKDSFRALRREFTIFEALGYNRFKVVPQANIAVQQRPPNPPLEGGLTEHAFREGGSGLFGEEAPGPWMTSAQAIERYKPIFLRYALTGDDPLISNKRLVKLMRRCGLRENWYDTHARIQPGG
jgi:FkbM family methyltransferase